MEKTLTKDVTAEIVSEGHSKIARVRRKKVFLFTYDLIHDELLLFTEGVPIHLIEMTRRLA